MGGECIGKGVEGAVMGGGMYRKGSEKGEGVKGRKRD